MFSSDLYVGKSLREKSQLNGRAIIVEKKTVERETINVVFNASKVLEESKTFLTSRG